eukprot:jgi/Mesvir1/23521/Mv18226-RA.1
MPHVGPILVAATLRMLRAIHHADNVVAIHVDSRVPDVAYDILQAAVAADPQLSRMAYFVSRAPVSPSGVTAASNLLRIMSDLLRREAHWDYWINLDGGSYPLLTQEALRDVLRSLPAPMDFTSVSYPTWLAGTELRSGPGSATDRSRWVDPALAGKSLAKEGVADARYNGPPSAKDVHQVLPAPFDDQHMAVQICPVMPANYVMQRASVEYLIHDPDGTVREWLVFFAFSFAVDERFFASVLAHAPNNGSLLAHGLVCDLAGAAPALEEQAEEQVDRLRACKGAFARKVAHNSRLLDLIDAELLSNVTESDRVARGVIEAIRSQFLPYEALGYASRGRGPYGSAADGGDEDHPWSLGEASIQAMSTGSSETFVAVRPSWLRQYSLKTTKYDVCREPFLIASTGTLPGGALAVKKAAAWGATHGVTQFSGSCCPLP